MMILLLLLMMMMIPRTTTASSTTTTARRYYRNVTLMSLEGDLSVTIFLPTTASSEDDQFEDATFYQSSRFDHSSMIGSIQRKQQTIHGGRLRQNNNNNNDDPAKDAVAAAAAAIHDLYGDDLWRVPHDPEWPESGIGLASEFGVGDNGAFCYYRCGWHSIDDVTNGVLGYTEARPGDSFLKIGVGELIKGSCDACDSAEEYKFNSPYRFAKKPQWNITTPPNTTTVIMDHEALLPPFYGYRLKKEVILMEDEEVLQVRTTLTNLGTRQLKTAWYSHHFFSCDGQGIGPGYALEMDLQKPEDGNRLYEEPGVNFWAEPITDYATVLSPMDDPPRRKTVQVELKRPIEHGTRIKTEFQKDLSTKGSFTLHGCGTSIQEDIEEFYTYPFDPMNMYGFNLYMERGTLSPEPQLLIVLNSQETKSWTQRLTFRDSERTTTTTATTGATKQQQQQQQEEQNVEGNNNNNNNKLEEDDEESFILMQQSLKGGASTTTTTTSRPRTSSSSTMTMMTHDHQTTANNNDNNNTQLLAFVCLCLSVLLTATSIVVLYHQHWQRRRRRHHEEYEEIPDDACEGEEEDSNVIVVASSSVITSSSSGCEGEDDEGDIKKKKKQDYCSTATTTTRGTHYY